MGKGRHRPKDRENARIFSVIALKTPKGDDKSRLHPEPAGGFFQQRAVFRQQFLAAADTGLVDAVVQVFPEREGEFRLPAVEFDDPLALSAGGMGGAATFAVVMSFIYRWGIRGLI